MPVEFICPKDGCKTRGFDEPPKTRMICRWHPEGPVKLVQKELLPDGAKNWLNKDETGKQKAAVNDDAAVEYHNLSVEYQTLTDLKPDGRWKLDTLRANVEEAREEAKASA